MHQHFAPKTNPKLLGTDGKPKNTSAQFPDSNPEMRGNILSQLSGLRKKDELASKIKDFIASPHYHKAAVEACRGMPEFLDALYLAKIEINKRIEASEATGILADSTIALYWRIEELVSCRKREPLAELFRN